jgi:hypothetical protein
MELKKIFINSDNLKIHGPNQSFGNHLSHLLFCYNFSQKRNFELKITTSSNLDEVFELEEFKSNTKDNLINYFSESFSANINDLQKLDEINLKKSLEILNDKNLEIPNNIYFSGWFYNVPLYPDSSFFNKIKIKNSIINYIESDLKRILHENSICIHYRGTDFNGHLGHDLRLPFSYYENCILHMKEHHKDIKNVFVFSEDKQQANNLILFLKKIDSTLNFEFIQNEYFIDWSCLHFAKNIISSNSSFCLTACVAKSGIIYQPKKYQLRNTSVDGCYPSQPFLQNSYIL